MVWKRQMCQVYLMDSYTPVIYKCIVTNFNQLYKSKQICKTENSSQRNLLLLSVNNQLAVRIKEGKY